MGAQLAHEGAPVAFDVRKAGERGKLLPAYESELRAMALTLTTWRQSMGSKAVIVETDHATSRILNKRR